MKIYGYKDGELAPSEITPSLLKEITLVASPSELRIIATFIAECAMQMEKHKKNWGHEHLSDHYSEFKDSPQFVIHNAV